MPIIQTENLSKVFRVPRKDPGVFAVKPGEIVGYIGVNGAGKSTTIKMLTGILMPSGGQVRVLGRDPHRERVANARETGVVFGQRTQLWWDLAFIESLNLVAKIYAAQNSRRRIC